jgi:alkylated DNA repair dioxygenase AlkB
MDKTTVKLGECEVDFYPQFYTEEESEDIFNSLEELPYEYTYYYMAFTKTKWSKSPRKMIWFAEDPNWTYFFSNNHVGGLEAHSFDDYPFLLEIKDKVEEETGETFNALLVNEYLDGNDRIDWHDDNDKWLGDEFIVPSLSFGSERDFSLRLKNDHKSIETLRTVNGSMMVMKGETQKYCQHAVPKRAGVKTVRYNLTFRNVIPELVNKMPKGSKKTLDEAKDFFEKEEELHEEEKQQFPQGLYLYDEVLSEDNADILYDYIEELGWDDHDVTKISREVQHYGYKYPYKSKTKYLVPADRPTPEVLECMADSLYNLGLLRDYPNQIIINKYEAGESIGNHTDHEGYFGNDVASLSLGSEVKMTFKPVKGKAEGKTIKLPLKVGSLLVFGDDARYKWTHGITGSDTKNIEIPRISVTFRNVKEEHIKKEQ